MVVSILGDGRRFPLGSWLAQRLGIESAFMVENASCTIADPRNGSGDEDMATMMVVVGDGWSGGGKYGTPGAGVIIYLAPEIGPADTAGRFNGRTMLELTKTKTKHQLGDFFFHFSFASFTLGSLTSLSSTSLSSSASPLRSPRFGHVEEEERRRCVQRIYAWYPPMPSSVSFFSHRPRRQRDPRPSHPLSRAATKSHTLNCVRILWRPGSRIVSDNG